METLELKTTLDSLLEAVKEAKARGEREQQKFGGMLEETKTQLTNLQSQVDAIDTKLAVNHR